MAFLRFKASIITKRRGWYRARADELAIIGAPASTQRGAIKNLKNAVLVAFQEAAKTGTLADTLDDLGYHGLMIRFREINPTLACYTFNTADVTLRLPRDCKGRQKPQKENKTYAS